MNKKNRKTAWLSGIFGVCLLFAGGCDMSAFNGKEEEETAASTYPDVFLQTKWPQSKGINARTVCRPYRLRENDKIEIIYHIRSLLSEEAYRIKIQDILSVQFPYNIELVQKELEVQSDGTIMLPLIGAVTVFDRTRQEVQDELVKRYGKYIKNPVLAVILKESKREILDLKEAITTAGRGQSRLVPITPDGMVGIPLIGSIKAAGRTVPQVRKAMIDAYTKIGIPELDVTVNINAVAPLRVYVFGEVKKPGLLFTTLGAAPDVTKLSLLQAVAQAGSYDPKRAELSKVLLIRQRDLPSPQVAVVNLYQFLENRAKSANESFVPNTSKFRHDIWLEDGDVIYIPTKEIAKRADYVEYVWTRNIYAVFPMSYSAFASYSITDAVNWLGGP